jgi:hypothetical protein
MFSRLLSLSSPVRPAGVPDERWVAMPGVVGVIFRAEQGFQGDGTEAIYWTPTREQVLAAEERLGAFLQTAAPQIARRLPTYRRQYVGVLNKTQRLIYLNCFTFDARTDADWGVRPVQVEDGGDAYFQVFYDIDLGEFQDLYINGEA